MNWNILTKANAKNTILIYLEIPCIQCINIKAKIMHVLKVSVLKTLSFYYENFLGG